MTNQNIGQYWLIQIVTPAPALCKVSVQNKIEARLAVRHQGKLRGDIANDSGIAQCYPKMRYNASE